MNDKLKKFGKFILRHAFRFAVFCVMLYFFNGFCFGFETARKLPEYDTVAQVEVIPSDPALASVTYAFPKSVVLPLAGLAGYCDYTLWHGEETAPERLTFLITTNDGEVFTVTVGDKTISFNGSVRGLKHENAVQMLTDLLLD